MFDRLARLPAATLPLRPQYRCHPLIARVASRMFYNATLVDGIDAVDRPALVANMPHAWVCDLADGEGWANWKGNNSNNSNSNSNGNINNNNNVNNSNNSTNSGPISSPARPGSRPDPASGVVNHAEASAIACLVGGFLRAGVAARDIGIVCNYRAQVRAVRDALGGPAVPIAATLRRKTSRKRRRRSSASGSVPDPVATGSGGGGGGGGGNNDAGKNDAVVVVNLLDSDDAADGDDDMNDVHVVDAANVDAVTGAPISSGSSLDGAISCDDNEEHAQRQSDARSAGNGDDARIVDLDSDSQPAQQSQAKSQATKSQTKSQTKSKGKNGKGKGKGGKRRAANTDTDDSNHATDDDKDNGEDGDGDDDGEPVEISTVDAFQGREKNIIIFSSVYTRPTEFSENARRVNVALTRARNHFVLVGRLGALQAGAVWGGVVAGIRDAGHPGWRRRATDLQLTQNLADLWADQA
jgi:hypothetical protein